MTTTNLEDATGGQDDEEFCLEFQLLGLDNKSLYDVTLLGDGQFIQNVRTQINGNIEMGVVTPTIVLRNHAVQPPTAAEPGASAPSDYGYVSKLKTFFKL